MRRDVTGASRVRVVAPGAADVVGLLEDQEVDTVLLQLDAHAQTGEPGPDDQRTSVDGRLLGPCCPRSARQRSWRFVLSWERRYRITADQCTTSPRAGQQRNRAPQLLLVGGRRQRSAACPERVDHQRGEPAPRVRRGHRRRRHHARIGQQHHDDVGDHQIRPDGAFVLRPGDEDLQFLDGLGGALLDRAGRRERRGEQVAKPGVARPATRTPRRSARESLRRLAGWRARGRRPRCICDMLRSKAASARSARVGNRRYSVATPTPARRAISSSGTPTPRSANTSAAADRIRSRLS